MVPKRYEYGNRIVKLNSKISLIAYFCIECYLIYFILVVSVSFDVNYVLLTKDYVS